MSKTMLLYSRDGSEFTAPTEEIARNAIASGEYFEAKPVVTAAAKFGLISTDAVVGRNHAFVVDAATGLTVVYDMKGVAKKLHPVDAREALNTHTFFMQPPTEGQTLLAKDTVKSSTVSAALYEKGHSPDVAEKMGNAALESMDSLTEKMEKSGEVSSRGRPKIN